MSIILSHSMCSALCIPKITYSQLLLATFLGASYFGLWVSGSTWYCYLGNSFGVFQSPGLGRQCSMTLSGVMTGFSGNHADSILIYQIIDPTEAWMYPNATLATAATFPRKYHGCYRWWWDTMPTVGAIVGLDACAQLAYNSRNQYFGVYSTGGLYGFCFVANALQSFSARGFSDGCSANIDGFIWSYHDSRVSVYSLVNKTFSSLPSVESPFFKRDISAAAVNQITIESLRQEITSFRRGLRSPHYDGCYRVGSFSAASGVMNFTQCSNHAARLGWAYFSLAVTSVNNMRVTGVCSVGNALALAIIGGSRGRQCSLQADGGTWGFGGHNLESQAVYITSTYASDLTAGWSNDTLVTMIPRGCYLNKYSSRFFASNVNYKDCRDYAIANHASFVGLYITTSYLSGACVFGYSLTELSASGAGTQCNLQPDGMMWGYSANNADAIAVYEIRINYTSPIKIKSLDNARTINMGCYRTTTINTVVLGWSTTPNYEYCLSNAILAGEKN